MENGRLSSDDQLGSQAGYSSVYVSYPVKLICKCTLYPSQPSFPHEEKSPACVLEYTPQDLALPDKAPDEYDNIHYTSENAHTSLSPTSPAAQHPVPASSLSSPHIVSSLPDHSSVNFNSALTSSEFG